MFLSNVCYTILIMRIGINASFLRKPDTGIGQVTTNFIKELIKLVEFKIPACAEPPSSKRLRRPRTSAGRQSSEFKVKDFEFFLYLEKDIDFELPENFRKVIFLPPYRRDDLVRRILWEKYLLPKKARKDKCDLFISLYQSPTVLKNTRHTMLVHDVIWKIFPQYLDNSRKKFYSRLTFKAIKEADEIITVSEHSRKDINELLKVSKKRIRVAYPSVGEEFFRDYSDESDEGILKKYKISGKYIFYIGGFDFRKNISGLMEAYGELVKKNQIEDVNLVLAGEDKSEFSALFTDIGKEIKKLGIKDKVILPGFVEQKDLPALYRRCELFVFPSLYEGFGLPVLEAMACGAPTLVSKNSSLPEVGSHAVLYFNPKDTEEMARVMGKVLRNDNLRKRLSEKGIERAKKFSWKEFVEEILK